jgi:RHS repeat-associated protein
LNRRSQKDYLTQKAQGSGDVIYNYDGSTSNGIGRLTSVQYATGTATFYYDGVGRTTQTVKVIDALPYTTYTSYDLAGRIATITYPNNGVATYAYNGPLLLKVYEGATIYGQYGGYNSKGQPNTLTFGNGVVTTYTYANIGNSTCAQQNFRPCTTRTALGASTYQNLTYTYDSGGKVLSITDPINGNQTFGYDELNRLTGVTGVYSHTYSYDQIGNILSNTLLGTYTYPASGLSSVRPHAVSTAGANTYTYDNNGNMLTSAGRTMTYDPENRPLTFLSGGVSTTMTYDGDGGRVKKSWPISGGTDIVRYISNLYECETTPAGTTCMRYIFAGGQRIAVKQVTNGTVDYYHADHLGSSSLVTTSTGLVEETLAYYAFGATRLNTGTANVPYKYTDQELDSSTGLYFYGARYYDATLGRFMSPDSGVPYPNDPQSFNRYSYTRNNPMNRVDPSGNDDLDFGVGNLTCTLCTSLGGPTLDTNFGNYSLAGFDLSNNILQFGLSLLSHASSQHQFNVIQQFLSQQGFNLSSAPQSPVGSGATPTPPSPISISGNSITGGTSNPFQVPILLTPVQGPIIGNPAIGSALLSGVKDFFLGFLPGYDLGKAALDPKAGIWDYLSGALPIIPLVGTELKLGSQAAGAFLRGRAPEFFGGTLTEGEFLTAAQKWLGVGYKEVSPGRFISQDGLNQLRYGAHEIAGSGNHAHFESFDIPYGKGGKIIENTKVNIIP